MNSPRKTVPVESGYGTIAAIAGNKLEIDFVHAGRKRVLDSFVSLGNNP